MKRWTLTPGGGLETLSLESCADPSPGPGEVVVRVRAASLNYRDLVVAKATYSRAVKKAGLVPCSDGAGEVEAVGPGVTALRPGDHVAGLFFPGWLSGPPTPQSCAQGLGAEVDGMLAERVALPAQAVVPFPSGYSFEEGACLPCAALTAWHALFERVPLRPGQAVLALGSGGVSVFALQMARAAGARALVTTGSPEKTERLRALGADAVVDRTRPDWEKAVKEATGGRGVDHVVETGGGGTLEKSVACLAPGGHIALLGVLAGPGSLSNPFLLVVKNATVSGIFVGSRDHFARMNRFLEAHRIRPVVDRTFPLEEAPAAFRHLESGAHLGKVVITL